MDKNVGGFDRQLRILAGAFSGLMSIAVLLGLLRIDLIYSLILGFLALILLSTAYTQKCPICGTLGHNSYNQ